MDSFWTRFEGRPRATTLNSRIDSPHKDGRPYGPSKLKNALLTTGSSCTVIPDKPAAYSPRRSAYLTTIGSTWDRGLVSYAAARDAACWQVERPESAVWSLLEGIESCYQDLKAHPVWR